MNFRTTVRLMSAAVLGTSVFVAGCNDLKVTNPNQPDVAHVFGSPRDVETIVSRLFQQMYNGQLGSADDIFTQTITMSFESSSQLGNFGMGTRGSIPAARSTTRSATPLTPETFAISTSSAGTRVARPTP
jgi:hypothetical protein